MIPDFYAYYRDSVTSSAGVLKMHIQDYYELYQYLGGDGQFFYFIGNDVYEPQVGEVLVIRPGIMHGHFKTVTARYRRIHVKIPPIMMDFIATLDKKADSFMRLSSINRVTILPEYTDEYNKLTEELRVQTADKSVHGSMVIASIVFRMLYFIYRSAAAQTENSSPSQNELIRRIIEVVNSEYATLTSAADIAAKLNYSPNYLSQYFKKYMNISLHEFLIQMKLSVSTSMLLNGYSVSDCASHCGFASTSYYIDVFKKRFHHTPKQYLKRINS